jgi:hypothetical protein
MEGHVSRTPGMREARRFDDSLRIGALLRTADPADYERAAVRRLGRFCLERPDVTLTELRRLVRS